MVVVRREDCDFPIVQINDRPRVLHDSGGIGRYEVFTVAQGQQQRRTQPRRNKCVWLVRGNHPQTVRAFHPSQGLGDRPLERVGVQLANEMRQHLCIGFGPKPTTALREPGPQRRSILDDAVVNNRDCPIGIGVRMRVHVVGRAVRSPTGVPQRQCAGVAVGGQPARQHRQLARRLVDLKPAV